MLPFVERFIYTIRLPYIFILFLVQDIYSFLFGRKPDISISLAGKTVIVTGATRGIGKQIARIFYQAGAKVIFTSRSKEAAQELITEFCSNAKCSRLVAYQVNLASLRSVRDFASEILRNEDRLDILINNAGIMGPKEKTFSEDKIEITFQVNCLSPILLTDLLLPLLKKTSFSRVVCVTSEYNLLPYYFDEDLFLSTSNKYEALLNYSQSKLALNCYVIKLSELLNDNCNPTINAVHPGCVRTDLVSKDSSLGYQISFYLQKKIRGVSPERGAWCPLYVATAADLKEVTGKYFVAGHIFKPSKLCLKKDFREKVWSFSQDLLVQSAI